MPDSTANSMFFDPSDLLSLAIMSKRPIVIVEGIDDVPIYERLADAVDAPCDIHASESLCTAREGCDGVIDNITDIRTYSQALPVEKYVMGIIDRDARFYRNEMPADPAIFSLKYYSIESHYVGQCSTAYILPRVTRATDRLITNDFISMLHSSVVAGFDFLYYVSLEALRNACEREYKGEFGYKKSIKAITNEGLHIKIIDKKSDLDAFAARLGLTSSMETLLKICKGKWVFETYGDGIMRAIKCLPEKCKNSEIVQCQFCAAEIKSKNKCLYKNPSFLSAEILMSQIWLNTEVEELGYIKDRISMFVAGARAHFNQ